jgi:hypothetical protein
VHAAEAVAIVVMAQATNGRRYPTTWRRQLGNYQRLTPVWRMKNEAQYFDMLDWRLPGLVLRQKWQAVTWRRVLSAR